MGFDDFDMEEIFTSIELSNAGKRKRKKKSTHEQRDLEKGMKNKLEKKGGKWQEKFFIFFCMRARKSLAAHERSFSISLSPTLFSHFHYQLLVCQCKTDFDVFQYMYIYFFMYIHVRFHVTYFALNTPRISSMTYSS